jgi:hypothetical protein
MSRVATNWWKLAFICLVCLASSFATLAVVTLVNAHGGDPTKIHSCVKANGDISIVGPLATCGNNQTPLDWNQQGVQGPPGPTGAPGISGWEIVRVQTTVTNVAPGTVMPGEAPCPAGKKVLGGGGAPQGLQSPVHTIASEPVDNTPLGGSSGFQVWFQNSGGFQPIVELNFYAVCANVRA